MRVHDKKLTREKQRENKTKHATYTKGQLNMQERILFHFCTYDDLYSVILMFCTTCFFSCTAHSVQCASQTHVHPGGTGNIVMECNLQEAMHTHTHNDYDTCSKWEHCQNVQCANILLAGLVE